MEASVSVAAVREAGPDTVALELGSPEGFDARPGQFVKLAVPTDEDEIGRFYTLSSPDAHDTLEITVEIDPGGELGPHLTGLEAGDEVGLEGPYGDAHYEGETRTVVLAGGPGVGPAVGIAERALDSWTPNPGTWPLPEYDPKHTAHNPHANPPMSAVANPDTWKLDVEIRHLLVANGFVIGAGLDGIRMVRPPEHGRWWGDSVGASAVGVYDGTLYAATPAGEDETGTHRGLLRGLELDTWAEASLWTTFEIGPRNAIQLLPTAGAAFVGYPSYADDRVPAFDPDSGDRVGELEGYTVSVANGTAYANSGGIVAYRPKTGIMASNFHDIWETPLTDNWRIEGGPTVVDALVLRGDSVGDRDEVPVVRAVNATSGERRWTTRTPSLAETTWTGSAAADGRAFVAGSASRRSGRLVAVDLAGEGVRWAVDLNHWYESIAVAGGLVLVAGGVWRREQRRAERGQVTALDAETGERRWWFQTDTPVIGVAPVEDVVYIGTQSGMVHALRAA